MKELILKKGEERRIRAGHLWVFSNEVDTSKTPLKGLEPGEFVNIADSRGNPLGTAYANPASLIAARMVSPKRDAPFDAEQLEQRIKNALSLRETLFDHPCYRLVHAEGDYLPGLVIDRYASDFAAQITTAGMERLKPAICEVMEKIFPGLNIVFRNDTQSRALENLPQETSVFQPDPARPLPEEFSLIENGLKYSAASLNGQKTGWFYDQRPNRKFAFELARGLARENRALRMLDAFSYAGGFGVAAAAGGAKEIFFLDASAPALKLAAENLSRNEFAHEPEGRLIEGDALALLADMKNEGEKFGLVSVDPPAFIKRKKDEEAGLAAYFRTNELALGLVEPGGYLISSSCSQHLPADSLRRIIQRAASRVSRSIQILAEGRQGPDHPGHPAMPETEYLKAFIIRVF